MNFSKVLKYAFIDALATGAYVTLVASFMYFMTQHAPEQSKTILIPISMLMLFVFSAAITGSLVFGRPIMWYLDGKKRESISLVLYTLGILLVITLLLLMVLVLVLY